MPQFGHLEKRKTSDNWYMVYRPAPGAKRIVRSTGTADQQEAYDQLRDLAGKYARGEMGHCDTPTRVTFARLFELLLEDYRRHERASTENMRQRVAKHLAPAFGQMKVLELRKRDVTAFVERSLKELSPASVNRLLSWLHRSLVLGTQEDPPLVLRIPDWFQRIPGERIRTGIITPEMYQSLKAAMETAPHARLAFVLAYHTGMRLGAILSLEWRWIDWRDDVIVIPADPRSAKPKPREVPVYGEMRGYLEMARESAQSPYIVERAGQPVESIKTAWHAACERAGLAEVLFHDLRRTAITRMEAAGIPRHVAMEASGHRTQAVYERYSIGSRKSTKALGREMERFMVSEVASEIVVPQTKQ